MFKKVFAANAAVAIVTGALVGGSVGAGAANFRQMSDSVSFSSPSAIRHISCSDDSFHDCMDRATSAWKDMPKEDNSFIDALKRVKEAGRAYKDCLTCGTDEVTGAMRRFHGYSSGSAAR